MTNALVESFEGTRYMVSEVSFPPDKGILACTNSLRQEFPDRMTRMGMGLDGIAEE